MNENHHVAGVEPGEHEPAGRLVAALGVCIATAFTAVIFWPPLYDDFTAPKQASMLIGAAATLVGIGILPGAVRLSRATWFCLAGWFIWLSISMVTALDWRGSILGLYQYRQGYLTHLVCLVIFLGAAMLSAQSLRWVAALGACALTASAVYAGVQGLGLDPITWWLDSSVRPIGTIGNANELAAFAIISVGWITVAEQSPARMAAVLRTCIVGLAVFAVVESQSKGGMIGVAVIPTAFALFSLYSRRFEALRPRLTQVILGVALGAVLATAGGGLPGLAWRFNAATEHPDSVEAGGATRLALWEGTLRTINQAKLTGVGPDGLHLVFPLYQPAGLGGDFADYDLVVQSSHNIALDISAATGVPGLLLYGLLVGSVVVPATARLRRTPDAETIQILAAMSGYFVMVMLNPLSLSAHAVFFCLLGRIAHRGCGSARAHSASRAVLAIRLGCVSMSGLLAVLAVGLLIADTRASRGWDLYAAGDFAASASEYHAAAQLLPIERQYLEREASALLAAGAGGDRRALASTVEHLSALEERHPLADAQMAEMLLALYGLGVRGDLIDEWFLRMVAANPNGSAARKRNAEVQYAITNGGELSFSELERLVRIAANPDPNEP